MAHFPTTVWSDMFQQHLAQALPSVESPVEPLFPTDQAQTEAKPKVKTKAKPRASSSSPERERGPRLNPAQRRQNHISSEHKRRSNIRHGFDLLALVVPGQENNARSEHIIINKTAEYVCDLISKRQALLHEATSLGLDVQEYIVDDDTAMAAHVIGSRIKQEEEEKKNQQAQEALNKMKKRYSTSSQDSGGSTDAN